MEVDTRFVCARDLFEGQIAHVGKQWAAIEEITPYAGGLRVTFEYGPVVVYERDDELEVVG